MDKLENIFDLQEELNTRIGVEMKSMTDEERIKWILNYIRAMQQELAELTDSVPWKWWAKYQDFDKQNAKVEIVDLKIDNHLLEKINKFAPIKYILKNNSEDEQKIIELLEDISRDLMNYDLEFRIQELESKFSVDMSETTFNELKELKKKQNLN